MKDDGSVVEKRLQNMKKFYRKASELIDRLPESIPEKTRTMLKDTIRDDVVEDIEFLKKLAAGYAKVNDMRLPIVVVVNKYLLEFALQ